MPQRTNPYVSLTKHIPGRGRLGREERRARRMEILENINAQNRRFFQERNIKLRERGLDVERERAAKLAEAQKEQAKAARLAGVVQGAAAIPQGYLAYKTFQKELAAPAVEKIAAETPAIVEGGQSMAAPSGIDKFIASTTPQTETAAIPAAPPPTAPASALTPGQYAGAAGIGFTAGSVVNKMIGGSNRETKTGVGFASGALAGAAYGSVGGPAGMIAGAIVGGVTGAAGGAAGCIIVTACTNAKSWEVNVTRRYRDTFLDCETLRGYYVIAEEVVPMLKQFPLLKRFTKYWLVDSLVDYAEYRLKIKRTKPRVVSSLISEWFLRKCKSRGRKTVSFTRANGEIV